MSKTRQSYWIKERHNPQFDEPYYVLCGQLGKREAKKKENPIYGMNFMLEFTTLEAYEQKIEELREEGKRVHA